MEPKGEVSDSVSLAYQRETREFRWVCIWAGLGMVCGLGILGVRHWNERRIAELLAGGADTKEVMSQLKIAANWVAGFGFPCSAFLVCFLISMVSWLLAIRSRRKMQVPAVQRAAPASRAPEEETFLATEEEEHPELVAARKAERWCFRFTAGSAAGLCLLLANRVGEVIWENRHSVKPFRKSVREIAEQLQPFFLLNSEHGLLVLGFGFAFFVSLAYWILAIDKRRRLETSAEFEPGGNR